MKEIKKNEEKDTIKWKSNNIRNNLHLLVLHHKYHWIFWQLTLLVLWHLWVSRKLLMFDEILCPALLWACFTLCPLLSWSYQVSESHWFISRPRHTDIMYRITYVWNLTITMRIINPKVFVSEIFTFIFDMERVLLQPANSLLQPAKKVRI